MKPSDILDKAADLIEPEGKWTQGTYARDAKNRHLYPSTGFKGAVCFCLEGAACFVGDMKAGEFLDGDVSEFVRRAAEIKMRSLHEWNDAEGRTQPEVVQALRDAANLARSEGQ